MPRLSSEEQSVVQQVEARFRAGPAVEAQNQERDRAPPLYAIPFLLLLRLLEWLGYGVMALIALGLAFILCYGLGILLWWLLNWAGAIVLTFLDSLPVSSPQPSPEPTPWVTATPATPGQERDPHVPWGRLHLTSSETGLQIHLHDEVENKNLQSGAADQRLPAGPYRLQVEKTGFTPFHASLIINPAATTVLDVVLKPTAGKLKVYTRPPQAQVKIDGATRGTTNSPPLVIYGLASGTHDIEVTKTGYHRLAQRFQLAPRHDHDLTLSLERAQGRLNVETQPIYAQVWLDQKNRGDSDADGRWQATVPAGSHRVGLRKAGYQDGSAVKVEVADGGTKTVELALQPLTSPAQPASNAPTGRPTSKPTPLSARPAAPGKRPPATRSLPASSQPQNTGGQPDYTLLPASGEQSVAPQGDHHSADVKIPGGKPPPAAHKAPRATAPPSADWPVFAGNSSLTGNRDDRPLRQGRLLWRTHIGKFSRAVAVADTVYAGTMDGLIYALDRHNGKVRWQVSTGGAIWGSPVLRQGRLYVGSDDGNLYALAAADGHLLWQHSLGSAVRGSPSIVGSLIVAGTEAGKLTALRLGATKERDRLAWSFSAGSAIRAAPVVVGQAIIIGTRASSIMAVDAFSGEPLWNRTALGWKLFSLWDNLGPVRVPVAYGLGRLFVARTDNKDSWTQSDLHVLSPQTGERMASGTVNGFATAPVFYRNSLYLGSGDGHLYALDAFSLQPRWRYNTRRYLTSTPAVGGGQVAFGCFDHSLYVLSADDGHLLYRLPTNGIVSSAPTLVNGQLFFGSEDGYLYAYE